MTVSKTISDSDTDSQKSLWLSVDLGQEKGAQVQKYNSESKDTHKSSSSHSFDAMLLRYPGLEALNC